MGVYISGMEMPDSCRKCRIEQGDAGYWWCGAMKKFKRTFDYRESRPDWCPLVRVPPHGDLIDRDALLNDKGVGTQIAGWGKMFHETAIEYAPTIIPADPAEEIE